jgi:hypothetical protein
MTLIISAVTSRGVWQLSDRRLIDPNTGDVLTDSATKVFRLELTDAKACIGYAGVGSVADAEISEWLKRLFRGRSLDYRAARNLLAASATKRLGPLVRDLHEFSIAAVVSGQPRFEVVAADRTQRVWKRGATPPGQFGSWSPQGRLRHCVYFSGSGRAVLNRADQRLVVQTLKRKSLTAAQLEDALVRLHRLAYQRLAPRTISYSCICTHIDEHGGGWSHLHDSHGTTVVSVPTIGSGLPVDEIAAEILRVQGPELNAALRERRTLKPNTEQVQEALKRIDTTPDDSLPWKK